ncbi:exodeoxyribonuclease VII large subunit, partial [bacterium]
KHPQANEIIAQAKAIIFENVKDKIFSRLKQTGEGFLLKDDIEVKLLCRVNLSPRWGLYSLEVYDIDPVYTLGKLAQDRQKIIEDLRKRGLFEKNKALPLALVPLNIGLITSFGSAAYHDFISELKASGFAFKIIAFDSHMQGKNVEKDIIKAVHLFSSLPSGSIDVLVITRGGGSTADLSWFDNKTLAEEIARFPLPVFTALGHQINTTVMDLVSHTSFKTPTKAARFIAERVEEFNSFLEESAGNILDLAYAAVENEDKTLHLNASLLSSYTQEYFARHKEFLSSAKAFLRESALNTVSSLRQSLSRVEQDIPFYCRSIIVSAKDKIDNFRNTVSILDPKNILRRGFSVVIKKDRPVKSAAQVRPGDLLKLLLYRGRVISKAVKSEENNEE